MSYRIIDYPRFVDGRAYESALVRMKERLLNEKAVESVYRIGSVSSPGISDLDLVVVFKSNEPVQKNFLSDISGEDRYLFIHRLYGIASDDFENAPEFAFYHKYQLIGGEHSLKERNDDVPGAHRVQVALEYMIRLYATLFIQDECRVLRMRDILLHVKALQYDLDLLGKTSGKVFECVQQLLEWRRIWFEKMPGRNEIISWWKEFTSGYAPMLAGILEDHPFYLPPANEYRIAAKIILRPSEMLAAHRQGFLLPGMLSFIGKKYFRIQNKMNSFEIRLPVSSTNIPDFISRKFEFEKKIVSYNKKFLPHFLPLSTSLHAI